MKLYILRHAAAVELGERGCHRDADRRLTLAGRSDLRQVARGLTRLGVSVEAAFSSPYVRARQTAELTLQLLRAECGLQLTETLAPGGSFPELVRLVNRLKPGPENVLLVGHEPDLSRLISWLVSGNRDLGVELKKAGLCRLEIQRLRPGRCAILQWLLTPRQLKSLG